MQYIVDERRRTYLSLLVVRDDRITYILHRVQNGAEKWELHLKRLRRVVCV